jgi:hypothetical protein
MSQPNIRGVWQLTDTSSNNYQILIYAQDGQNSQFLYCDYTADNPQNREQPAGVSGSLDNSGNLSFVFRGTQLVANNLGSERVKEITFTNGWTGAITNLNTVLPDSIYTMNISDPKFNSKDPAYLWFVEETWAIYEVDDGDTGASLISEILPLGKDSTGKNWMFSFIQDEASGAQSDAGYIPGYYIFQFPSDQISESGITGGALNDPHVSSGITGEETGWTASGQGVGEDEARAVSG